MQTGPRISKKPCVVLFSYISVEGLLCMFFNLHPIVFVNYVLGRDHHICCGELEILVSQPVKTWTNFGKFREYV